MKKKRRYLALGIQGGVKVNRIELSKSISYMIKEIFGDLGLAEAEIRLVKLEVHKNVAILRCNKDQVDKVRFAMLFLKKIGVNSVIISIIEVSGTIKGLKGKTSIW